MTQFPSTSTSLQFDPRSTTGEVNASRRDNQSNSGSSEDSRFSRALDDSSSRSDVRRDDAQTSVRDRSPRDNDLRTDRTENAAPENAVDQSADPELGNDETETSSLEATDETETGSLEATVANEQDTTDRSDAALFDPFSLIQQLTNETTPAGTDAVATEGSLLASTTITGFLPNGEGIGGVVTAQQNLSTPALQGTSNPLQAGPLNQNLAAQANIALSQLNGAAGNVVGDVFENVLTTQLSNAGAQTTATSAQALASNLQTNVQPNSAASILQASQLGELNLTNTEGEQFGALLKSNQQTASPSQQLASLLSSTSGADIALPNPAQLTNPQLQQVLQQPVQQASQPLAQFANAAFANDTVPAFTAQISRNFAAGQDAFNVRLNPSELGRVDVRVINNDDGTVSTQIRVERSETLDLFQRDIRALERSLLQSGIKLGSEGIDLSLKDNGTDQGGNSQAFDNDFDGQGEHAQNSDPALETDDANQYLDNDGLLVDDLTADIALDQVQTIYARYQPGQLNIRV